MLRPPEFGNTFKFTPNTRFHRTLNGNLRTYQGNVPTWEGFRVSFTAINQADMQVFRAYVIQNAGQEITLTDHENRQWHGIIVSPQLEIIEGMNECNYETNFEFEGNLV